MSRSLRLIFFLVGATLVALMVWKSGPANLLAALRSSWWVLLALIPLWAGVYILNAIAWRMLGNREEAHDAAQETFLRVYRHLRKFDARRDFSGWLYRITINVCRDQARKRGRLPTIGTSKRNFAAIRIRVT